jgi:hypothetical protein
MVSPIIKPLELRKYIGEAGYYAVSDLPRVLKGHYVSSLN